MRSYLVLIVAVLAVLVVGGAPCAAQSTYVGGSVIGELARFGSSEVEGPPRLASPAEPISRSWETFGFDVRVGRGLGQRWGVELSWASGGTYEQTRTNRLFSVLTIPTVIPTLPGVTPTLPSLPVPDLAIEMRVEQQHTTLDSALWLSQELGERLDLVFLGGVSFNRVETEQHLGITDSRLGMYLPYPSEIESERYGVGPVVGVEAITELSSHAALTAGVRLHGVDSGGLGGWLIRPAVGLRWTF